MVTLNQTFSSVWLEEQLQGIMLLLRKMLVSSVVYDYSVAVVIIDGHEHPELYFA